MIVAFIVLWIVMGFLGTFQLSRDEGARKGTVGMWVAGMSLGLLWLPAIVLRFYIDNE